MLLLAVAFLWSPLTWDSSSAFPCLSLSWQFGWLLVSYFVEFLSICVWCFFMVKVRWCIFGQILQKQCCAFFQCIITRVHDVDMSHYWWGPPWSFGKGGVCLCFSTGKLPSFPLSVINIWETYSGGYINVPFLLKPFFTDFNIHRWILPTTMITVMFA